MPSVKAALVGAGSFVFGTSMLSQAILENRLDDMELALMDIDSEVLELMAGVGRRMARDTGVKITITTHTERRSAFEGASFVLSSAARQINRRFQMDCDIIDRLAPGHLVSEFGGVQGISYSLRQIELVQEICADMRALCPDAWLLDAANPLPRVVQAAHEEGIRSIGFCAAANDVHKTLWRIYENETIEYPWKPAADRWIIKTAGLNHFAWLIEFKDRQTGEDLMPDLLARIRSGADGGNPRCASLAREIGSLLVPNDDHTQDFLPDLGNQRPRIHATHGSSGERAQRLKLMADVGNGDAPWDGLLTHAAWERPMDLVGAMAFGRPAQFAALNLVNGGQIAGLPNNVIVETPAKADSAGPVPKSVTIPEAPLAMLQRTARVTDTIVRAARSHSRVLLKEAVELDPTILDKVAGLAALEACMVAHADILAGW